MSREAPVSENGGGGGSLGPDPQKSPAMPLQRRCNDKLRVNPLLGVVGDEDVEAPRESPSPT